MYVRDPDDLQRKLGRMAADGASKLQVCHRELSSETSFYIREFELMKQTHTDRHLLQSITFYFLFFYILLK